MNALEKIPQKTFITAKVYCVYKYINNAHNTEKKGDADVEYDNDITTLLSIQLVLRNNYCV